MNSKVKTVEGLMPGISFSKILLILFVIICIQNTEAFPAIEDAAPKMLIAYFSMSGNTRQIAEDIQKMTGADIFEIKTVRNYGPDFGTNVKQAQEELKDNSRPELKGKVEKLPDYNVVFLGFPNWVGTMPMALFSFLEQYDFTGKTIVPFCTHGTSGIGATINDLKNLNLNAEIKPYIDFYRNEIKDAELSVRVWLQQLGYLKTMDKEGGR